MRVLIIHNGGGPQNPSGEFMVARDELYGLQSAGVRARLEVVPNPYNLSSLRNISNAMLNIFWSRASRRWLSSLLRSFNPHIVHFHGVLPVLSPAVFELCHRRNLPVVQTLHNFRWLCIEGGLFRNEALCTACLQGYVWAGVRHGCTRGSPLASLGMHILNQIYRRRGLLYKWVDRFIAVSHFVRDWHTHCGFPTAKMVVKYNGLDLMTLPPLTSRETRRGIAYVGRLSEAKGAATLRCLIRELSYPINIVGQGEEKDGLRALADGLGRKDVVFWGRQPREEVLKIVGTSRCVVVPSVCGETWSMAAAESIAMATPVVAYAVGGLREMLAHGRGSLVRPFDHIAFSRTVGRLYQDTSRAQAIGQKGHQFALNQLNMKVTTAQLLEIYQDLLS